MILGARASWLAALALLALVSLSDGRSNEVLLKLQTSQLASKEQTTRWLLAWNETSLPVDEEQCGLQPLSTPTYGILEQLQAFLEPHSAKPHKSLLPLSKGDISGFILTILVLFIAAGGGIGGGGAIIPLYILFLGFTTRIAVALGNITIVGGALSNFVFNVPRRHAFFNRPLVDWDLILVMEPSTILGALIGGYLNKLFPNWVTTILLALLLTFISYKLVVRGFISWHKESTEHQREAQQSELDRPLLQDEPTRGSEPLRINTTGGTQSGMEDHEYSPLAYTASLSHSLSLRKGGDNSSVRRQIQGGDGSRSADDMRSTGGQTGPPLLEESEPHSSAAAADSHSSAAPLTSDAQDAETEDVDSKQKELDNLFAERRQIPPLRFGILVLLTAVVAASDILKSLVRCASWGYWLIVLAVVPVVLLVTFGARNHLLKKRQRKQAAGYIWREGDVDWNPVTTLTYPAICSLAGLVAGMFGVGGGIIKMSSWPRFVDVWPLMLELGEATHNSEKGTDYYIDLQTYYITPNFTTIYDKYCLEILGLPAGVLPDVAAATSATMIVFTSASASIVFISFGGIPVDYAVTVFVIGIIFTMLGQVACYVLMTILRRRSIIVFAMAALMLLSMIIVYYEAITGTIAAAHNHALWHFGKLCA